MPGIERIVIFKRRGTQRFPLQVAEGLNVLERRFYKVEGRR
jgi:hypothetical protein